LENLRGRYRVVERAEHQRVEVVLVFGPHHSVVRVDQEADADDPRKADAVRSASASCCP
jgi:hypothetical protein